eukprot:1568-Pelagomonas_calceolata.AAC.1
MQPSTVTRGCISSVQCLQRAGTATYLSSCQQGLSSLVTQHHHIPTGSSLQLDGQQLQLPLPLQDPNPAPSVTHLPPFSMPFSLGYPSSWQQKPGEATLPGLPLAPSLECAVPKKKMSTIEAFSGCMLSTAPLPACSLRTLQLSQHRQSQRRQWYHLQRIKEMQQCPHCKAVGGNNNLLTGLSSNCNGMCLEGRPQKTYPPEHVRAQLVYIDRQ